MLGERETNTETETVIRKLNAIFVMLVTFVKRATFVEWVYLARTHTQQLYGTRLQRNCYLEAYSYVMLTVWCCYSIFKNN